MKKQKLLEELRKEYQVDLKPLKEAQFSVKDILDKYYGEICDKLGIPNTWRYTDSIGNALRKAVCIKYGANSLKEIEPDKRLQFREDFEKFIREFILEKEKVDE